MRVRANLTRIFSNRWSVSCRVCENRFEKLLYKKSREQGGEEKLENNRGDRVAVLTPFLFFLSSSVCSLCNVFPLVPIALFHPIPSPHVHPPPPRRLSFCATLRGSTIFWLEKRPVLHKPEKWKKKGGKDCETRQAKKRIR